MTREKMLIFKQFEAEVEELKSKSNKMLFNRVGMALLALKRCEDFDEKGDVKEIVKIVESLGFKDSGLE